MNRYFFSIPFLCDIEFDVLSAEIKDGIAVANCYLKSYHNGLTLEDLVGSDIIYRFHKVGKIMSLNSLGFVLKTNHSTSSEVMNCLVNGVIKNVSIKRSPK